MGSKCAANCMAGRRLSHSLASTSGREPAAGRRRGRSARIQVRVCLSARRNDTKEAANPALCECCRCLALCHTSTTTSCFCQCLTRYMHTLLASHCATQQQHRCKLRCLNPRPSSPPSCLCNTCRAPQSAAALLTRLQQQPHCRAFAATR